MVTPQAEPAKAEVSPVVPASPARKANEADRIVPCEDPRSPVEYCPAHSNCVRFINGSDPDEDRFTFGCQCPPIGFTIEQTLEQSTDKNRTISRQMRKEICVDIDECADNKHNCTATATCRNTVGGFECDCLPRHKMTGKFENTPIGDHAQPAN